MELGFDFYRIRQLIQTDFQIIFQNLINGLQTVAHLALEISLFCLIIDQAIEAFSV